MTLEERSNIKWKEMVVQGGSKITGRSGVLGLREEGAETVHLM